MIDLATALMALSMTFAPQAAPAAVPQAGWTWTLYVDEGPIVLANEIPDTAHLRTVLECERSAGVVQLTIYDGQAGQGMARVSAGQATAVAEAQPGRSGGVRLNLPADHPALSAFSADGEMTITQGQQSRNITVPEAHLAKLRRFTELCAV